MSTTLILLIFYCALLSVIAPAIAGLLTLALNNSYFR